MAKRWSIEKKIAVALISIGAITAVVLYLNRNKLSAILSSSSSSAPTVITGIPNIASSTNGYDYNYNGNVPDNYGGSSSISWKNSETKEIIRNSEGLMIKMRTTRDVHPS